jgi:hypothetical protein
MATRKRRNASTPGPKPGRIGYRVPLALRISEPMMAALQKTRAPSTTARLLLVQAMLDKGMIKASDLPE